MTPNKYVALLLVSCALALGAVLVAVDSPLIGRPLTRIAANSLADRTVETGLRVHAIEGRGNNTQVSFIRAGDAMPLQSIFVNRCSPSRCLDQLSASLWRRDVHLEIASHIFMIFDGCGLRPIAIPEISLPWATVQTFDQRPVGKVFGLRATVLLDAAHIEADPTKLLELAKTCLTKLVQEPTDNPGWHMVTDDVSVVFRSVPLANDYIQPIERPVLELGPYDNRGGEGAAVNKYGQTIECRLAMSGDQIVADPPLIWAHPAVAENHIRIALKPSLLAWLAETAQGRNTDDLAFMASDVQAVDGSTNLSRIFIEVIDSRTSESAIVAALIDLEMLGSEAWHPERFELVAAFGMESAVDVPQFLFDLEDPPDE